ncbi:GTPase HflX [Zooshikella marina]|uniref:ribosome rescue GTPase HflX n=1 Tax=Zooshikella ganghwensis TaxID=202772 RepID=UPI001BAFC39D|nr:ribosome rescue GTPase HflX [Zooshikella ganghwensis]MBU2706198.1 GTPase HflX [Zooshikella ganghwensis]
MFFERHQGGEHAILVHPELIDDKEREDPREFEELVGSAGANPVAFITSTSPHPHPKFFIGKGKVEEVRQAVKQLKAEIVIFNHSLSPTQERNLERELECRVVDRTGLILDIFAQRARTHEGKLQVELAQLQHLSTRLVRGWTHLERQKGGIGLRGPGETQLETDRRLLRERIKSIQKRLDKVRKQRDQSRRSRKRADVPLVSLVGYTNAGKSTLFNTLTTAEVYAADQLFATLDPTLRRIDVQDIGSVIVADTVGFIRHLPHKLVQAFRATLEETVAADLLIHVIDCYDSERDSNIEQVNDVLLEIGAEKVPSLLVYNKIDLLADRAPQIDYDEEGKPWRVWVSALSGEGMALIKQAIAELLGECVVEATLQLKPSQGRLRAELFRLGAVLDERSEDHGGWLIRVRMQQHDLQRLAKREGELQTL